MKVKFQTVVLTYMSATYQPPWSLKSITEEEDIRRYVLKVDSTKNPFSSLQSY